MGRKLQRDRIRVPVWQIRFAIEYKLAHLVKQLYSNKTLKKIVKRLYSYNTRRHRGHEKGGQCSHQALETPQWSYLSEYALSLPKRAVTRVTNRKLL